MHPISDEPLIPIRASLEARKRELRDRIRRVQEDLGRSTTPLPRDAPDAALIIENDEVLAALDEAARTELTRIEHALARMDLGLYAVCERCGAGIDAGRLTAVPYTTHCRECAPAK
jgi:DnaK suppressor protein